MQPFFFILPRGLHTKLTTLGLMTEGEGRDSHCLNWEGDSNPPPLNPKFSEGKGRDGYCLNQEMGFKLTT